MTSCMHPSPLGDPFDWLWQLPQLTIGYPPRWIMSWRFPRHTCAPSEREVYMEIPHGYDLGEGKSKTDYAVLLHRNVYGQKQAA